MCHHSRLVTCFEQMRGLFRGCRSARRPHARLGGRRPRPLGTALIAFLPRGGCWLQARAASARGQPAAGTALCRDSGRHRPCPPGPPRVAEPGHLPVSLLPSVGTKLARSGRTRSTLSGRPTALQTDVATDEQVPRKGCCAQYPGCALRGACGPVPACPPPPARLGRGAELSWATD